MIKLEMVLKCVIWGHNVGSNDLERYYLGTQ